MPTRLSSKTRTRSALQALTAGVVLLVLGACANQRPLPKQALPSEPIAMLHWEGKAAKSRSEAFGQAGELPPPPPGTTLSPAAEERAIRSYLDARISPMLEGKLAKYSGRLVLYWPQTKEIERIEAAPPNARPLAWSADHKKLLFVSAHRDDRRQIYEYDIERKDLTVVTVGSDEHARADYGPDGQLVIQRIATLEGRRGRARQTAHLATASGRLEKLVGEGVRAGSLRLSPDGSFIVYEQVKSRPRSVGATVFESMIATRGTGEDASDRAERILTRGREPALTPDGRWIVFASPSSSGYRLRRMRPDGTSRVVMSAPYKNGPSAGQASEDERMPTVSPDGEFVAFIADSGSSRRLSIRRFDGKGGRELLKRGWAEFPVW